MVHCTHGRNMKMVLSSVFSHPMKVLMVSNAHETSA